MPGQLDIRGFEFVQRAEFFQFFDRGGAIMQDTGLVVNAVLCLTSGGSHFNEKFISRLCGNACFGVWPKHNSYLFLTF